MSHKSELFPTFNAWYTHASHLFMIAPLPIRIAVFPTLLILASLPLALVATFTQTSVIPRAYDMGYTSLPSTSSETCIPRPACLDYPDPCQVMPPANGYFCPPGSQPVSAIPTPVEPAPLAPLAPILQTLTLPPALRGQFYLTTIVAEDPDLNQTVKVHVSGLPAGISMEFCKSTPNLAGRFITNCTLSGLTKLPPKIYPLQVVLTDSQQLITRYTVNLEVVGRTSRF